MKVLIVDDEAHVIKAVKLLVPWQDFGITEIFEARSPQEAIRLLEAEKPELMITDIVMQELTGIDLMEYITGSHRHTKVVVISGYDNFEYVRGSLQNGSVDYLLKPLDQGQLIAAVKKAAESWKKEAALRSTVQSHEEQIQSMTSLCRENLLLKMLAGDPLGQSFAELLKLCPELGKETDYGFGYADLSPFMPESHRLAVFLKALSDFLDSRRAGFLLPGSTREELRIFFSDPSPALLSDLEGFLSEQQSSLPFPAALGFAWAHAFPQGLSGVLGAAKRAYGFLDIQTHRPLICRLPASAAIAPAVLPEGISREEEGRRLLSALLTGNEAIIDKSIGEWLQHQIGGGPYFLRPVLACLKEEHRLFDSWVRLFCERHQGFSHQSSYRLPELADVCLEGLRFSPEKLAKRMHTDIYFLYQELKNIRSPEADTIYQVAHYIELNYQKPFSQNACAQLFFLNKEYLCRKFKQTFHVPMITYLNDLRIRRAKQLLEDPDIRIRQIAHDVGFEDEKYFSRQFKKMTGQSPGDYRALHISTNKRTGD